MPHSVRSMASRRHPGNPPVIDHLPEVAAEQAVARHLEAFTNLDRAPTMAERQAGIDALIEWRRLRPATAAGV